MCTFRARARFSSRSQIPSSLSSGRHVNPRVATLRRDGKNFALICAREREAIARQTKKGKLDNNVSHEQPEEFRSSSLTGARAPGSTVKLRPVRNRECSWENIGLIKRRFKLVIVALILSRCGVALPRGGIYPRQRNFMRREMRARA